MICIKKYFLLFTSLYKVSARESQVKFEPNVSEISRNKQKNKKCFINILCNMYASITIKSIYLNTVKRH